MREQDERDIAAYNVVGGLWLVLRRGSPRRKLTLLKATLAENEARECFLRTQAAMRQGMVALVDPSHKVVAYTTEPMVRTRW